MYFSADLKAILRGTVNTFQETINKRSCFSRLLTTRNFYLNKVSFDVSRMATLMDSLVPDSAQYDQMRAKGK